MVRCDECGTESTGWDTIEHMGEGHKPWPTPGHRYSRRYCTDCMIKSFAPMPDPQMPAEAGRNDKEPQEKVDATGNIAPLITQPNALNGPLASNPLNQILRLSAQISALVSLDTNDLGQHTLSIKIVL